MFLNKEGPPEPTLERRALICIDRTQRNPMGEWRRGMGTGERCEGMISAVVLQPDLGLFTFSVALLEIDKKSLPRRNCWVDWPLGVGCFLCWTL